MSVFAWERAGTAVNVAVRRRILVRIYSSVGTYRVKTLRICRIDSVCDEFVLNDILSDVINNESVSWQTAVEGARILAVLHEEVLARRARLHAVGYGLHVCGRHVSHNGVVVEHHGVGPSPHILLPSVDARRARTIFAAPCAASEQVPNARSAELSAGRCVVGIVEVGRAESMSELMAYNTYRTDVLGETFRLYGVASYGYAVERLSVDDGAVRPDVVGVGRSLLTRTLVNHGKSVENTVAVVVEVSQIERVGDEFQSVVYHVWRTVGSVCALRFRQINPVGDGNIDVELAIRLLQIVVAETSDAFISVLVHHLVEVFSGESWLRVVVVYEQQKKFVLSGGRKSAVDKHLAATVLSRRRFLHLFGREAQVFLYAMLQRKRRVVVVYQV